MQAEAVIIHESKAISLDSTELITPGDDDLVVESAFSGISTGTERLFFEHRMPHFPGLAYPLVPGYETIGRVVSAGDAARDRIGETVFVPGARCYRDVAGLFGATASRLVVAGSRAIDVPESLGADGTLLALAATAHHAIASGGAPQLIIGHGVLGRICARLIMALDFEVPTVWESNPARTDAARDYPVTTAQSDTRAAYGRIMDVSGDPAILDQAIARLEPGGEITLAGFYSQPLTFDFAPAFMREARIRVAAEFRQQDTLAVLELIRSGQLDLSGLITHQAAASDAPSAYPAAFEPGGCLKMVLDWRR